MNLMECIASRRAVRSFTPKSVDEATIRMLLSAAVQAPSAMNAQPWSFAVVQDTSTLKRYSNRAKVLLLEQDHAKTRHYAERLRDDRFNIFYDASTLIIICTRERGPYTEADCWLAAENLMLTACDVGLGTCCIGFALPLLGTKEAMEELGIPAAGKAVAPIIVGYPSGVPANVPRTAPQILSWKRPL